MFAGTASHWSVDSPIGGPEHYREQVLREVHHRVKNHLQVLQGLVRQDAMGAGLAERRLADRLVHRLGAMAAIYKGFQEAADRGSIPAVPLLQSICEPMSTPVRSVSVSGDGLVRLGRRQAELASMLVSEAVCNSLEHAFPGGRGGRVDIVVQPCGRAIQLTVQDNGIGFDLGEAAHSNGIKIMMALAGELGGRIDFQTPEDGGCRLCLTFPLDAVT